MSLGVSGLGLEGRNSRAYRQGLIAKMLVPDKAGLSMGKDEILFLGVGGLRV